MTVKILTLGPGKLVFGEKDSLTAIETQVTKCVVKPSVKQDDPIPVLSGEKVPGNRSETAALAFTIFQDLGETASVVEWTWKNAGKETRFEFIPVTGRGKVVRGRCTIERSEIGGEVGEKAQADLEFACVTMPTIEDEITGPGA